MSPARRTVLRQLASEAGAAGDHDTVRDCYALLDGNDEDPAARRRIARVLRAGFERAEEEWDQTTYGTPSYDQTLAEVEARLARWDAIEAQS